MKLSEDSRDTLRRIALAEHLFQKYPYLKYTEIFNFVMATNPFNTIERRLVLAYGIRRDL